MTPVRCRVCGSYFWHSPTMDRCPGCGYDNYTILPPTHWYAEDGPYTPTPIPWDG